MTLDACFDEFGFTFSWRKIIVHLIYELGSRHEPGTLVSEFFTPFCYFTRSLRSLRFLVLLAASFGISVSFLSTDGMEALVFVRRDYNEKEV